MRAGFCRTCNENVYLDDLGNCINGHSAEHVSGTYDVPDSTEAPSVSADASGPEKTPLHKQKWFLPAAMLVLGMIVGGLLMGGSDDYASQAATLATEKKDVEAELVLVQSRLAAMTEERDSLKAELDPVRRAEQAAQAEAAAKAEAEATAKAEAEARAQEAAAKEAAEEAANTFTDGVYHVGEDMKAGRYKGHATSDMGYWAVLADPNGSEIIENNLVKGQFYVEVKKGQYIELTNVEMTLVD